jgi:DNA-binding CsgD family transcriptional regulator
MHKHSLLSAVMSPLLVGRVTQLATIERLLQAAQSGQATATILLLRGEAGIGKTRLLRALQEQAVAAGWRHLESACFEYSQGVPYAPLSELLRPTVPPAGVSAAALALLPELGGTRGRSISTTSIESQVSAQDQHRLFAALADWFVALAAEGPLLLAIEDLHWSDTATLAFLPVLARRLAGLPALLAVTLRTEESSPALRAALAEFNRQRLAIEVVLGGLSREEIGTIVRTYFALERPVHEEFLDALYTLTDGNPFFVEEVLTALISTGDIFYTDGAWSRKPLDELRIPQSIQEAVARRTALLSPATAEVLTLAAALGRRFGFGVLQQATGHDEATLLAMVKELIAVQLIVEESAEQFAFRHALGRATVYNGLLARERRVLHRRLAEALERAGGIVYVADLARHYAEAQVWDRALRYADEAATAALQAFAPHETVSHLTSALVAARHLPGTPLAPMLHRRGQAHAMLDNFVAALADSEDALVDARCRGHRADEWQALLALGFLWSSRDFVRAGDYFQQMIACARTLDDPARLAHSLNRFGNWQLNLDRPLAAGQAHREAFEIFSALGDEPGLAETLDLLGISSYLSCDLATGTACLQRAVALFEAQNNRHALVNSLAQQSLRVEFDSEALDCAHLGDRAGQLTRAVALAREIDWRAGEAFARLMQGFLLIGLGDYGVALDMIQTSLAIAREIEHRVWATQAQMALGILYLDLLLLPEATEQLRQAMALARDMDLVLIMRDIARYLAAASMQQGQLDQAADELREAAAFARAGEEPSVIARQIQLAHAELSLTRGEPERALAQIEALIASTVSRGTQVIARLWLVRGQAYAGLRRYNEAHATLAEALVAAQSQGRRPLVWRIQAALVGVHEGLRRREAAQASELEARMLVDQLALPIPVAELRDRYRTQAHATIPKQGTLTPRQALKQTFGGLTDRELEVVRLIARGYTNRQIAATLVLSERTISTHIGNIYGKLGFTARAQVITWAIEKGIRPAP